jgi:5-methylcytosine-specific restriction endonuclease McrA
MHPPSAFKQFVATLGTNQGRNAKRDLANLSSTVTYELGRDFSRLLDLSGQKRDEFEAQVGLILSSRALWQMVPQKLFDGSDPNYERLAKASCERLFGADSETEMVSALATIYRNLRRAHFFGRNDITSLNLLHRKQRKILEEQKGRCACCGYQFTESQIRFNYADPEDFEYVGEPVSQDELCLDKYYRQPVLDHIIPHFISGDHESNWQILCQSCNAGKGEAIAWMLRAGWMPVRRLSEVTRLTPSLRYAVISKFNSKSKSGLVHSSEVRIRKINSEMLVTFDNLEASYESKN